MTVEVAACPSSCGWPGVRSVYVGLARIAERVAPKNTPTPSRGVETGRAVTDKAVERAAVLTLTVKLAGVVPCNIKEVGVTKQLAAVGAPLQLRLTFPVAPAVPLKDKL